MSEEITVKKFMLKKFPTNEYMDCPVPKHHWETIQEYADQFAEIKAQGFAEWLCDNDYNHAFIKDKYYQGIYREALYTTSELYSLYLKFLETSKTK